MRSSGWVLLILVGVLVACGERTPETPDTITKYRSGVGARFATVRQIGNRLKGVPALSRDGVTLDSGPVKLWNGLGKPESSETAVIEEEARLENLIVDPGHGLGSKDLWWCAMLLGGKFDKMNRENAEAHLGHCINVRYLLVVRVLERSYPKVDDGKWTFQSGSLTGEVRVFNLATGKDLGGFRFKARNSDVVMSREGRARDYSAVSSDLTSQAGKEVSAGIAKHLGGS